MRSILTILLVMLLSAVMAGRSTKTRTKAAVSKEKTEMNNKISQTQKKIRDNKANTSRRLAEYNALQSQIKFTADTISRINAVIDSITVQEKLTSDSIAVTEARIQSLEKECSRQLRDSRRQRKSMSNMALVVSSPTLGQAMKRTAYIKQLNRSIVRKSTQLGNNRNDLEAKRSSLSDMKTRQQHLVQTLTAEQRKLTAQKDQTAALVDGLKREGAALNAVLQDQRAMAQRLDAELNALIAEEKRRAEEEKRRAEEERLRAERERAERQRAERQRAEAQRAERQRAEAQRAEAQRAERQRAEAPSADAPTTRPKRQPKADNSEVAVAKPSGGGFAANKGKMLFPVSGNYTIVRVFGVNKHDNLPYVQTENAGIDIKANDGAARSVFEGTVSTISYIEGYHNVVMVRHGEYLTIYAGIDKLNVRKGDKVTAGQSLGQIYKGNDGAVLHFEVRRETQKLNPLEWVRR